MKYTKELPRLFFATRQLVRQKLPQGGGDHNAWMRFETLKFIEYESGEPPMHAIAEYLRVKAPSATSLIRLLEGQGLVTRVQRKEDKRIVRIALTAKGKKELASYKARAAKAIREVFSKISNEDAETLVRILQKLQDAHRP